MKVSSRLTTVLNTRKVQTGQLLNNSFIHGTGQDASYVDVTISGVSDITKCIVTVQGCAVNFNNNIAKYYPLMGRLTSATNLRISLGVWYSGTWFLRGRYYVVDLK